MTEQTQSELLAVAKEAMKLISVHGIDSDFVFKIRDIIRKVEQEVNNGQS